MDDKCHTETISEDCTTWNGRRYRVSATLLPNQLKSCGRSTS